MDGLYTAQLIVSKCYTDETISNLVERVSNIGDAYYNNLTKTIDIKVNTLATIDDDNNIRNILREWVQSLDAKKEYIELISKNVPYIFNIYKIGFPNIQEHTICIQLY